MFWVLIDAIKVKDAWKSAPMYMDDCLNIPKSNLFLEFRLFDRIFSNHE